MDTLEQKPRDLTPRVDFTNTNLAFRAKSTAELRRAQWMFKLIGNPLLTNVGTRLLQFSLRLRLPIEWIVRATIFELFVGGESLEATSKTSADLFAFNVRTILDYSVEGEKNRDGYDATADEIVRTLIHGGTHEEVTFTACKISGLASFPMLEKWQDGEPLNPQEQAELARARARLERICQTAVEQKTPVFIDAEESWIQDSIDRLAEEMMEKYNGDNAWVATTVQLYRHDRLEYLRGLIERSREGGFHLGVKLVRGAYLERENERAEEMGYPTPMQPNKAATDRDYDAALALCVDNIEHVHICAGTHNEASSRYLTELIRDYGYPANHSHILFSQLLGMSDNISFNLGAAGYNTAKYLPYGPVRAVVPYLIRRARENTSVAGQSSRELQLITEELQRRKRLE